MRICIFGAGAVGGHLAVRLALVGHDVSCVMHGPKDYELGRPMEIDALVRAPQAFARATGLSTPMPDFLAALTIRQARDKGLYQA